MDKNAQGAFPRTDHDHARCQGGAMARAAEICARRGARFTELRRRVLEIVWQGHRPVGAYDILEVFRAERPGAAPPTVYRALDFLLQHGLVHRIESRNAYVGCVDPEHRHEGYFLICRACGRVAELEAPGIDKAVATSAAHAGFVVERTAMEVEGLCPDCREEHAHG